MFKLQSNICKCRNPLFIVNTNFLLSFEILGRNLWYHAFVFGRVSDTNSSVSILTCVNVHVYVSVTLTMELI